MDVSPNFAHWLPILTGKWWSNYVDFLGSFLGQSSDGPCWSLFSVTWGWSFWSFSSWTCSFGVRNPLVRCSGMLRDAAQSPNGPSDGFVLWRCGRCRALHNDVCAVGSVVWYFCAAAWTCLDHLEMSLLDVDVSGICLVFLQLPDSTSAKPGLVILGICRLMDHEHFQRILPEKKITMSLLQKWRKTQRSCPSKVPLVFLGSYFGFRREAHSASRCASHCAWRCALFPQIFVQFGHFQTLQDTAHPDFLSFFGSESGLNGFLACPLPFVILHRRCVPRIDESGWRWARICQHLWHTHTHVYACLYIRIYS